ncbi:MAG: SIMPL domain-containing protein [Synergistota bacterium]|nr:SIMPL domain-containing protein [Synergistota bacterium]
MAEEKRPIGFGLGLAVCGGLLALGLIFSSMVVSDTVKTVKLANQTILVKGFAQKPVTSDVAVWSGRFTASSRNLVAAYKKLQDDLEKVLVYLENNGISRDGVDVSSVSTRTQYMRNDRGYETNEIDSYILEQTVSLNSTEVQKVSRLSKESTSLIEQGVEFYSYSPQYYFSKLEDLKIELLGQATRNASERAHQLAEKSGGSVGALRSASQGVFQITPRYSTDVEDYGMYDTSTIEKSVKAVVTIQYTIEN